MEFVAQLEAACAQALAEGAGLGELPQQVAVRAPAARGRPYRLVQPPFALARVAARAEQLVQLCPEFGGPLLALRLLACGFFRRPHAHDRPNLSI